MKIIAILLFNILSTSLLANEVKIHSLCDEYDFHIVELGIESKNETVGSLTIRALVDLGLDYVGSERSISSLDNSPTGIDALEYKDAKNMKSYGWCYLVSTDESLPSEMPDEYKIDREIQNIHWFYAYSEMVDGNWISFCVPTHLEKPDFICKDR